MDKIAVLIPCYNESQTIRKVVEDCRRVLPEAVIYVYDNNSVDGTADIAREAGAVVCLLLAVFLLVRFRRSEDGSRAGASARSAECFE